jgi:hypothetical protein
MRRVYFFLRAEKLRVELKITDETRSRRHVFLIFKKEKVKEHWIVLFLSFQYNWGRLFGGYQ